MHFALGNFLVRLI